MEFLLLHIPSSSEIEAEKIKLIKLSYSHWIHTDLFTLNWWILLCSTIIPYFIWWKLVDKKRFFELFSYGLMCASIAMVLDVMGTEMMLWDYPDKFLPWIPPLIPADFVVIPISAMLIYQYFNKWISFLFVNIIWAIVFAYIIEPIFLYLGMFKLGSNWHHTYSFIGFFFLGLFLKLFIAWLKRKVEIDL
ncbi:CBO0543 family protein [Niallia sp. NCCP-28]|uniref:CBO0543 family protein n=1 Tax=Niallia sp. NCCP-28 TaxID=2934712 RepID=UPI00208C8297|nr:CBO0543 family protein [Niallia sp. NCCP-28]GKU82743.1 hypothetical protein NCCP28_21390 [Niallia sp. NCCP-28]